ncbi:MAG: ABC transporter permease [Clostridia bacterium]|nr:ABC transporter permease [Clostridia bacterium]
MTDDKVLKVEEYKSSEKKGKGIAFSRKDLCLPYGVFLLLFVVFPFFLILYYAFTSETGSFSFRNLIWFFSSKESLKNLFDSIVLGLITMLVCLILAYPIAYILSRMKSNKKTILLLLFIMPMWINFVLRAMAMKELLNVFNMLNKYNYLNTVIGMVYDYLPFMVLPLYTTLIKRDTSLEEAALDLGANKVQVFLKITFPLSLPGIISGITMVFLPSMTCYVISDTYGSGKVMIIGKLIEQWFGMGSDWHYGSFVALVLLVIMFLTTLFTGRFLKDENTRSTII